MSEQETQEFAQQQAQQAKQFQEQMARTQKDFLQSSSGWLIHAYKSKGEDGETVIASSSNPLCSSV
ncbi:hypothetical protein BIW11_04321 [Tropilaelaps mercedesae]|uniref:Uncharacterized protein n=1 Tax=Tropilaelaps mercedesae TaxID=418985 RepID=A0A1V9X7Y5_9ACAR|nr:hypothetical protein BIW11_04321 [Tropilaelaps mercedesae]